MCFFCYVLSVKLEELERKLSSERVANATEQARLKASLADGTAAAEALEGELIRERDGRKVCAPTCNINPGKRNSGLF